MVYDVGVLNGEHVMLTNGSICNLDIALLTVHAQLKEHNLFDLRLSIVGNRLVIIDDDSSSFHTEYIPVGKYNEDGFVYIGSSFGSTGDFENVTILVANQLKINLNHLRYKVISHILYAKFKSNVSLANGNRFSSKDTCYIKDDDYHGMRALEQHKLLNCKVIKSQTNSLARIAYNTKAIYTTLGAVGKFYRGLVCIGLLKQDTDKGKTDILRYVIFNNTGLHINLGTETVMPFSTFELDVMPLGALNTCNENDKIKCLYEYKIYTVNLYVYKKALKKIGGPLGYQVYGVRLK